jgi:hypothetical protein
MAAAVTLPAQADPLTESAARPLSREQSRSRRPRLVRAKTVNVKRLTRRELERGRLENPPIGTVPGDEGLPQRPRTRGECKDGPRPCPWVSCSHHLFLDVSPAGAIKLNFPDLEPHELAESCSLDVADRGGVRLEDAGMAMSVTRERIRQVEVKALGKLWAVRDVQALGADAGGGPIGKRRLPIFQPSESEVLEDLHEELFPAFEEVRGG